jgi:hypothetical protein
MAAFLRSHRYSRKTPGQLLVRLRSAPTGRAGEVETRARRAIVIRLTQTLQVLVEQIHGLEIEIGRALDAHPDGEIFRSFFKTDSVICAATLLSEIGDCRRRYPHRDAIAADAGQAPVAADAGQAPVAVESGNANTRSSAGHATSGYATRSPPSRTAPAAGTHGLPTATPTPESAGITTAGRSAPSAAPGPGSSGAAGRTAPHTTRPATPASNNTSS